MRRATPTRQYSFEMGSALTTAPASSVVLINGASPCNVYWQVGSSATLETTTAFQGNLMALTSISLNNGASVVGRVLARNGQIRLDQQCPRRFAVRHRVGVLISTCVSFTRRDTDEQRAGFDWRARGRYRQSRAHQPRRWS